MGDHLDGKIHLNYGWGDLLGRGSGLSKVKKVGEYQLASIHGPDDGCLHQLLQDPALSHHPGPQPQAVSQSTPFLP